MREGQQDNAIGNGQRTYILRNAGLCCLIAHYSLKDLVQLSIHYTEKTVSTASDNSKSG